MQKGCLTPGVHDLKLHGMWWYDTGMAETIVSDVLLYFNLCLVVSFLFQFLFQFFIFRSFTFRFFKLMPDISYFFIKTVSFTFQFLIRWHFLFARYALCPTFFKCRVLLSGDTPETPVIRGTGKPDVNL